MEWMLMPLKRYADFSGRSRRQEYWLFVLFTLLVYLACLVVLVVVVGFEEGTEPKPDDVPVAGLITIMLLVLVYLGLFIPTLAVKVRRFHDQDLSGWFVLLGFIPYLGPLIVFIFMCIDGTPGPNRFGPDPQGRGDSHASIFA